MFVKGENDASIDFQSAAEVFYFAKIASFFTINHDEVPLGEVMPAGFMKTIKAVDLP
jgi:hypothetical protein